MNVSPDGPGRAEIVNVSPDGRVTRIILGSASPRRASLLTQIGVDFSVMAAYAEEEGEEPGSPAAEYVTGLSRKKAEAALKTAHEDAGISEKYDSVIVIGADTVVVAGNGEILGKPADARDAKRMLRLLSGTWHEVFTGVTVISAPVDTPIPGEADAYDARTAYEKSRVKICALDEAAAERYVRTGEPFGKAGAYAIQGAGSLFIERIDGCYSNVVGLPLRLLYTMTEALGYDLISFNKGI